MVQVSALKACACYTMSVDNLDNMTQIHSGSTGLIQTSTLGVGQQGSYMEMWTKISTTSYTPIKYNNNSLSLHQSFQLTRCHSMSISDLIYHRSKTFGGEGGKHLNSSLKLTLFFQQVLVVAMVD